MLVLLKKYEDALEEGRSAYFDADEFGELAEYYDANGDIEIAREVVETGLAIHPDNASLTLKKAKFLAYDGEYATALGLLNASASYDLDLYLLRIECFLQMELPAEAHALTAKVLENEDTEIDTVLAELGFLYIEADYFDEAILYFKKSLEYSSENIDVLSDLAYAYEMIADYDGAIETSNKILDIDSYSYEAWVNLGKLYSLKDEYEKAIDAFDFALTINDSDANVAKLKAHCLSLCGRFDEAILLFNEILLANPDDVPVYFLLAECYESLGMYNEVLSCLDSYEELQGPTIELVAKKVGILIEREDLDSASDMLNEALLIYQESKELKTLLGEILMKQNFLDEAEDNLLRIYDENTENSKLLDMLAVINIKKENYQNAIEYTEQLLDIEPYNVAIKHRLALLYFEIDNKEEFNALLEDFSDRELQSLFQFIYTPKSEESISREDLIFYLNEARETRKLFRNLKY